jgi:hypothetical protein
MNAEATAGISGDLVQQLSVTKNISSQLGVAAASLNKTSQAKNDVLMEMTDRMEHLDVYVALLLHLKLVDDWLK